MVKMYVEPGPPDLEGSLAMKSTLAWGLAIALILIAFGATFLASGSLPDRVPIHWNIRGEVDGYAPKSWGIWLLPVTMVVMLALMAILPRFFPKQVDFRTFHWVYEFVVLLMLCLFGFIQVLTIAQARNSQLKAGFWMASAFFLFFALLGTVMGKIPRNQFMGIRVPWTLASDRVWQDTHRLAGWLWMGAGVLGMLLTQAGYVAAAVVLLVIAVIVPLIYSYFDSRRPDVQGG